MRPLVALLTEDFLGEELFSLLDIHEQFFACLTSQATRSWCDLIATHYLEVYFDDDWWHELEEAYLARVANEDPTL